MGVKFLAEGDWEWGGTTAYTTGHGNNRNASPSGGWKHGGTVDVTITPGPCPGNTACCPTVSIADTLSIELDQDPGSICDGGAFYFGTITRDDADPDCPAGSKCWVGTIGITSCLNKLVVFCEPGGTWAWLVIGEGCDFGSSLEGVFDTVQCTPSLNLRVDPITCVCGGTACSFALIVEST